jgi:hypothetical protein
MTVQDIMDRVSTLYNDASYERVSKQMYLNFLDDALNQLVMSRPDSHVRTTVVQLDPGTRQRLPEEALSLIDIYRNMGQDGVTQGSPIWQVNRKDLDYFSNWHSASAVDPTEITEFSYDARSQKTYWASPAPGSMTAIFVEMDYSYSFPKYATLDWDFAVTQAIDCDDTFQGPICSYMLYILYSTDSASKTDKDVAEKYRTDFYNALGIEMKAGSTNNPMTGDAKVTTGSK